MTKDDVALESASISLVDCLACSGCITSAESVLVAQQSHAELYKLLSENDLARQVWIFDSNCEGV